MHYKESANAHGHKLLTEPYLPTIQVSLRCLRCHFGKKKLVVNRCSATRNLGWGLCCCLKPRKSARQDFEISNFGPFCDGVTESEGPVLSDIVDLGHGAVVTEGDEEVAKLEFAMFVAESVQ